RSARTGRRAAAAEFWGARLPGRYAPALSLSRSPPRDAARQYRQAYAEHRLDAPTHERDRNWRICRADPHRIFAGRSAWLAGVEPCPSGQVLCATAGATAI